MSDFSIELSSVSKCFRQYAREWEKIGAMFGRTPRHPTQDFWALKPLSISIPRGETWGILGRNGSGKSTLLQLIAGTLTATTGDVNVHGRVAALLELGSGFHPEFTGRENVFFQGQIQGCDRAFMESRFEEIVNFAGIGHFLDHPVKTYSSGMRLRLAFAVTIALEPQVLIIDEALAVGDEAFQRKCFARIHALQEGGCTVLFVSHSGAQIIELCDHALLLDAGEMLTMGTPKRVVAEYHRLLFSPAGEHERLKEEIRRGVPHKAEEIAKEVSGEAIVEVHGANCFNNVPTDDAYDPHMIPQSTIVYPSQGARIENVRLETIAGERVNLLTNRSMYVYAYDVIFDRPAFRVRAAMLIKTLGGFELGGSYSHTAEDAIAFVEAGQRVGVAFRFSCDLQAGVYFLNAGVLATEALENREAGDVLQGSSGAGEVYVHRIVDAAMFRVQPTEGRTATAVVDFRIAPRLTTEAAVITSTFQRESTRARG